MNKKLTGFTLIELIVTLVVLSIMSFSVLHILVEGFRVWWINKDLIDLRSDSRTAINRIVMDFRGAYSGTLTSSTDFSFNADIYSNGNFRNVRYYLDGSDLRRQENSAPSPGSIICSYVSNLSFNWNSPVLTVDVTASRDGNTIRERTKVHGRCVP